MMMHHDAQPLCTRGNLYGLLNQVRLLRKAGAISVQVLMITPATGSKLYESAFTCRPAYDSVAGRRVEPHMMDANYVVASQHPQPWRKQLNIMFAYLYFYNPLRLLVALVRPKSKLYLADAVMQLLGMWGLAHTVRRTFGWTLRLTRGNVRRWTRTPASPIPTRHIGGEAADATLPETPPGGLVPLEVHAPATDRVAEHVPQIW
jgi:hypothetical protein